MKQNVFFLALAAISFALIAPATHASDRSADEQQLRKIEQDWGNAYVKRDPSFAERLTLDDFTFVEPDGVCSNKADYLKGFTGDIVFSAFDIEDLKIRFYGDTAVVLGTASIKAKSKDNDLSGRYAYTDVFVKQSGEWKAVAGQVTAIPPKK